MGRRTLLTPEMHHAVIELVEAGNLYVDIARTVGINPTTIGDWRKRGEVEMELHPDPNDYTRAELVALAADQGVEHKPRAIKKTIANLIYQPTPFTEFAKDLTRARGEAITNAIEKMRTAGKDDWRMWRYYLSVMAPERFSQRAIDDAVDSGRVDPDQVDTGAALERGERHLRLVEGAS